MENWILLCADNRLQHLFLLKEFLENQGLEVNIMEKDDSAFPSVGESELFVKNKDFEIAKKFMTEFNSGQSI